MFKKVLLGMFVLFAVSSFGAEKFKIAIAETLRSSVESEELINKAFEKLGDEVERVYLPGERAIRSVDAGDNDGDYPRIKEVLAIYPNIILVDEPIRSSKIYAYTINKPVKDVSWEKLKDYNVASPLGIKNVEAQLKDNMRKGKFEEPATYDSAVKMLQNDRVDYFVMAERFESVYLKDAKEIKRVEPCLEEINLYIVLNKKHKNIAEKLAKALKDVKNKK